MKSAMVIQDEIIQSERHLIDIAQSALSSNWTLGKCASTWCEKYANGRTDADFANLCDCSQQQVNYARRVYEAFGDVYKTFCKLTWSHFYAALNWDDASECLAMAEDMEWSVRDMRRWRKSQHASLANSEEELFEQETEVQACDVAASKPVELAEQDAEKPTSEHVEESPKATLAKPDSSNESDGETDSDTLLKSAIETVTTIGMQLQNESLSKFIQAMKSLIARLESKS